jgi:hypothetical protein
MQDPSQACCFAVQLQLMAKTMLSKIPLPATLAHEQGLLETIWLLFTSVLVVPAVCKIPGGSPVLGFLAGGALIGPHALGESYETLQPDCKIQGRAAT